MRLWLLRFAGLIIFCALSSCSVSGLWYRSASHGESIYHTVKTGETLTEIAEEYGVQVKQIALLNGIRNVHSIRVGQQLLVSYGFHDHSSHSEPVVVVQKDRAAPPNYQGGRLHWPVAKGRLVSRFGPRSGSFHDGIDIAAQSGTPVFAAHSGEVIYSNNGLGGYGNLIIIRDSAGVLTVYAHNKRLLVRKGASVHRGQKIALVGSTGRSSGPHLHFEIRMKNRNNKYAAVDPLPFFSNKEKIRPRYRVNEGFNPLLASRSK